MAKGISVRGGGALLIATLVLVAGLTAPAWGASPPASLVQAPADLLYVCNQDDATVTVVDIATLSVLRTIDLQQHGFGPNAKPHHVVVEADGSAWYVSLIGENRVVKFDASDRPVGSVEFETPGMLALHPDGRLLLVGRSMSAVNPPQRIGVIDRTSMEEAEEMDVFFPRPHALAIGPETGVAYTASLGINQMGSVDVAEDELELLDVPGPQHALMQFSISPDGRTLVASAELSGRLLVFDLADPMNPALVREIEVKAQPFDPLYTRDGSRVFLSNKAADTVTVVNATDWSVAAVIEHEGILEPHGTVNSPDGRYVFVSSNNTGSGGHAMHMGAEPAEAAQQEEHEAMDHGDHEAPRTGKVVVLDAATHAVVAVIDVGRNATGMGARQPR